MKKFTIILSILLTVAFISYKYEKPIHYEAPKVEEVQGVVKVRNNGYMPDPAMNPGYAKSDATPEEIAQTICNKKWTTDSVRPPVSYTNRLKIKQIAEYGYEDTDPSHYSEDHIVSLWLLGDPKSPLNLFPQLIHVNINSRDYGSKSKDKIELQLHTMVCKGYISLKEAQKELATDWVESYRKHIGELPRYESNIFGATVNDKEDDE